MDSMRFVKDENWIQFEVKSTEDVVKKDTTVKKGTPPPMEKKVYYFEYNINTGELVQLTDLKKPKRNTRWASRMSWIGSLTTLITWLLKT